MNMHRDIISRSVKRKKGSCALRGSKHCCDSFDEEGGSLWLIERRALPTPLPMTASQCLGIDGFR
jgi:hypothetical protein